MHARVQTKLRVCIPKQVDSACSKFFGIGFEGKIRVVECRRIWEWSTDVINRRIVDGITRSSDPISGEKSITSANSARFRHGKFIAYAVFMLNNFIRVFVSLSLLTRDLIGFTIVRIVFPLPFLSFSFFFYSIFFHSPFRFYFCFVVWFFVGFFLSFFNPAAN